MAELSKTQGNNRVGDGTNYTETRADGTQRLKGTATAWKDMVGDLFGRRLLSTSGKVDYDYDENLIVFSDGGSITNKNDRVGGNLEINHEFKVGNGIVFKPHIHWFQEIASGAIVTSFELTMRYRVQKNGDVKTTSWTDVTLTAGTDDIFDFTGEADGIYNQLTKFPDITTDCSVSDTIQFQIARTDNLGNTMEVYFMDIHGEVDSFGSDEEIAKVN